jgi:hypothetical protein
MSPQKAATVQIPQSGRYVQGTFKVICQIYGLPDVIEASTTVEIPPACTVETVPAPKLGNTNNADS